MRVRVRVRVRLLTLRSHTVAGIDFIGIDDKRQRLLHLESAADCDAGVSSISQSLLQTYPHLQAASEP